MALSMTLNNYYSRCNIIASSTIVVFIIQAILYHKVVLVAKDKISIIFVYKS